MDENFLCDLNAERACLGAMMLRRSTIDEVFGILRGPEDFFDARHKIIAKAILELGDKADPLSVTARLKGKESPEYISSLSDFVGSIGQIENYSGIVRDRSVRRDMVDYSREIAAAALDKTHEDLVAFADARLSRISDSGVKQDYLTLGEVLKTTIAKLKDVHAGKGVVDRIDLGWEELDRIIGGLMPGNLMIVGGRPGMGKTSLAVAIGKNNLYQKRAVGYFSLEMNRVELVNKILSGDAQIFGNNLRQGKIQDYEWGRIATATERMMCLPMWIDDTGAITLNQLRAKTRRMVKDGAKLIIVDYLQLMGGQVTDYREQFISSLTRGLKRLARELSIPIIALSQLNRAPAAQKRKPILADLRESGAIEQDADQVVFVHVDDEDKWIADIIVAKNRHGETGEVKLKFHGGYCQYSKLEPGDYQETAKPKYELPRDDFKSRAAGG